MGRATARSPGRLRLLRVACILVGMRTTNAAADRSSRSRGLESACAVLRQEADYLRARGIVHLHVFGSVARREDNTESDLDLVAEVRPGADSIDMLRAEEHLAPLIGRSVGIISRCGLTHERHGGILRDMVQVF